MRVFDMRGNMQQTPVSSHGTTGFSSNRINHDEHDQIVALVCGRNHTHNPKQISHVLKFITVDIL